MTDTKRTKLSLPSKPADARTSDTRTRAPLRGSNKPRAPRPADFRPREERGESGERPTRGFGDKPRGNSTRGDQPQNRGNSAERPRRNDTRTSFSERPARTPRLEGRSAEERRPHSDGPTRAGGDRPPRDNRSGDDRRPYGERPARPSGDRPARSEARKFDERRSTVDRPARSVSNQPQPSENAVDQRRPYVDRPQREGRSTEDRRPYADRPRREGERPSFGDRPPRPGQAGSNNDQRRPYAERPRRDIERDGPAPRPNFGDEQMAEVPRGNSFSRSRGEPRPRTSERSTHIAQNRTDDTVSDEQGAVRLSKLMSERGLCSRREADDYIERGWVKVDGRVISELGSKVMPHQRIELTPVAAEMQMRRITVLINKPIGYVSGQAEDGYEPAAVLITQENHWAEDPTHRSFDPRIIRKLAPAGRLDIDSTGLLVLTQDGRVAKQLVGEYSDIEKEYLVRVEGDLTEEGMHLLHHGLILDGVELLPAKVSWQNEDQLRFVLHEGRKRQIRRMCELVGLRVVGLKRIRIGRIPLSKLPVGQWRYLGEHEAF